jgi:hypothetical protein
MQDTYRYLTVRIQIEQHRFLYFAVEAGILSVEGDICSSLRVN